MVQTKINDEELTRIAAIHEVLSSGDNILKAHNVLTEAMQNLVNYSSEDFGVMFQEHTLIVEQLKKAIKELDSIIESDRTFLTESDLILFYD